MRHLVLGALLCAYLLGICAGAAAAGGASAPTPALNWGVVDMERVSMEDKGRQALTQQFQDFQKQQDAQLQRHQRTRTLLDEERREYLDLTSATAAPTPERDKRVAELERVADERSRRLLDLEKNPSRTAEEEQEYQKLNQLYKQRSQEFAALQGDAQKAVVAKYEEFSKLLTASLEGAIKVVAEEKKLTMILVKETVLFGGLDVTADVIAKLNASPVSAAGIAAPPQPAGKPAAQPKGS